MNFFKRLFSAKRCGDVDNGHVPVAKAIPTPPVVLRLYPTEVYSDEGAPEGHAFLLHQWRCGEVNHLTGSAARLIRKAYDDLGEPDVYGIGLSLSQGYYLHAAQMQVDPNLPTQGKVHMVLYISALDFSIPFGKDQSLYGPLTPRFIELMQHIAIRLNAFPTGIHTSDNGEIFVMFYPHDPKYDLKAYFEEYFQPTGHAKVSNNGAVDDPSSPMAGG